jgi:hypothetical protein
VTGNRLVPPTLTEMGNKLTRVEQNGPFGENLAPGRPNATAAIDSWGPPKRDIELNNETSLLDIHIPSLRRVSKFTQLVWKNSTQLGCGRTNCGGQNGVEGWLVVCEFSPRGNIAGEFEANVQGEVSDSAGNGGSAGKGTGVIGAAKSEDGKRPNVGDIGQAKNDGGRLLNRLQIWFVFALVWLVMGAVFL